MRVIILAAGHSRRFKGEGYDTPKPFLIIDFRGSIRTMLEHVICTVPLGVSRIHVAIPQGWAAMATSIDNHAHNIRFTELEHTKGPGQTALRMVQLTPEESVLIMDVDVLNFTNDLYNLSSLNCAGVLVSKSADPMFSYVEKLGVFNSIREKGRISQYAVRGAYFIPSHTLNEFSNCLATVCDHEQEPFLSHAFDRLQSQKRAVLTTYNPVEWGTPRDLQLSGATIITPRRE